MATIYSADQQHVFGNDDAAGNFSLLCQKHIQQFYSAARHQSSAGTH